MIVSDVILLKIEWFFNSVFTKELMVFLKPNFEHNFKLNITLSLRILLNVGLIVKCAVDVDISNGLIFQLLLNFHFKSLQPIDFDIVDIFDLQVFPFTLKQILQILPRCLKDTRANPFFL